MMSKDFTDGMNGNDEALNCWLENTNNADIRAMIKSYAPPVDKPLEVTGDMDANLKTEHVLTAAQVWFNAMSQFVAQGLSIENSAIQADAFTAKYAQRYLMHKV